jgi:FkbM family methyltransferase
MFLCHTRRLVRIILHFGIRFSPLEGITLLALHYTIPVFRRICDDAVLATIDGDVKLWLRLTKLLEAYLYFLGVDAKDRYEVKLIKSMLTSETVVIDVGANIGQICLLTAKYAKDVHAFEPNTDNFAVLERNIQANPFTNITANHSAVSNSDTPIVIYVPRTYNTGAISAYPDNSWEVDTETVSTVRLDDYCATFASVGLIKIDVEGAELDVLEGASTVLRHHRPVVFMEVTQSILHRANRSVQDVLDYFAPLNYQVFRIGQRGELILLANATDFIDDQNVLARPVVKL